MTQTALITGFDTNAIARSIATHLLGLRYGVVAVSDGLYASGQPARAQFDAANPAHASVTFETVQVDSADSVRDLLERLGARTYDVVVNCGTALALTSDGQLRDEYASFDYAECNRVLQYTVTFPAAVCLGLKDSITRGGTVINVTSSAAAEGAFATISYNAAKAAVNSLTKSLANTLGSARGITVNSISPGWIPPSADAAADGTVALANALTPSQVAGTPDDVLRAVDYLLAAPFQNGAVIELNGGITSSYLPYMLEALQLRDAASDDQLEAITSQIASAKRGLTS